jgi:hypothetical protein
MSEPLETKIVKRIVHKALATLPNEITCGECFERVDRFVEMELAGKNAAEAMPLVEAHLRRCDACREEFEALLDVLRALA